MDPRWKLRREVLVSALKIIQTNSSGFISIVNSRRIKYEGWNIKAEIRTKCSPKSYRLYFDGDYAIVGLPLRDFESISILMSGHSLAYSFRGFYAENQNKLDDKFPALHRMMDVSVWPKDNNEAGSMRNLLAERFPGYVELVERYRELVIRGSVSLAGEAFPTIKNRDYYPEFIFYFDKDGDLAVKYMTYGCDNNYKRGWKSGVISTTESGVENVKDNMKRFLAEIRFMGLNDFLIIDFGGSKIRI